MLLAKLFYLSLSLLQPLSFLRLFFLIFHSLFVIERAYLCGFLLEVR